MRLYMIYPPIGQLRHGFLHMYLQESLQSGVYDLRWNISLFRRSSSCGRNDSTHTGHPRPPSAASAHIPSAWQQRKAAYAHVTSFHEIVTFKPIILAFSSLVNPFVLQKCKISRTSREVYLYYSTGGRCFLLSEKPRPLTRLTWLRMMNAWGSILRISCSVRWRSRGEMMVNSTSISFW